MVAVAEVLEDARVARVDENNRFATGIEVAEASDHKTGRSMTSSQSQI